MEDWFCGFSLVNEGVGFHSFPSYKSTFTPTKKNSVFFLDTPFDDLCMCHIFYYLSVVVTLTTA